MILDAQYHARWTTLLHWSWNIQHKYNNKGESENLGDFGGEILIKIENILKCNVGDEFVVEHVVDVFMHN